MPPTPNVIPLDFGHIALAAALMLLVGGASVWLRLGLEKTLLVASVRTVAQLLLIGYVLRWVFGLDNPAVLFALLLVMIALASHAAIDRSARTYRGVWLHSFLTLTISGLLTTFTVTEAVIQVTPWYRPQYVVPLLGMVLGSTLTGVSLSLDSLLETLAERRAEVEMELAHGATAWEAFLPPFGAAVRRGLIPTLNSMMVVGVVSLPGMMTGQILSGVDPAVAVRYQIVVMFLLAAANALGCVLIGLLCFRCIFHQNQQLDSGRILRRNP